MVEAVVCFSHPWPRGSPRPEETYNSGLLNMISKMLKQVKTHVLINYRANECDNLCKRHIVLLSSVLSNSHESDSAQNTSS